MFSYIYTSLLFVAYGLAIPFLIPLIFKKKYKRSIPARFFLFKNPPFSKSSIHFHSCSLGETKLIEPLAERFDEPNISVITQTGFNEAKKISPNVRYLPFEPLLWWWLKPQKALVVAEAELWYLLFFLSRKRGARTLLINARISDRSYRRYLKFRWLYKRVFENIDAVFAQSEKDRQRLEELGAKNVKVVGNLKLLNTPRVTKKYEKRGFLSVAASTHEPEEEIIATAWLASGRGGTLAVVPRHPERFEEVDELLSQIAKRENLSYHKLSQREDLLSDIVLVDKVGELNNIYAASDLVILGGSFTGKVGGHNPLEPAFFNKPIISGEYFFNQKESYDSVEGIEITQASKLAEAIKDLPKPTKIVKKADIKPILKELEDVV